MSSPLTQKVIREDGTEDWEDWESRLERRISAWLDVLFRPTVLVLLIYLCLHAH